MDRNTGMTRAIERFGAQPPIGEPPAATYVAVGAPVPSPSALRVAEEVYWAAAVRRRAEQLAEDYERLEPKPLVYPPHVVELVTFGPVSRRVAFLGRLEFVVADFPTTVLTGIQVGGALTEKSGADLVRDEAGKPIVVFRKELGCKVSMRAMLITRPTVVRYCWHLAELGDSTFEEVLVALDENGAHLLDRPEYLRRLEPALADKCPPPPAKV